MGIKYFESERKFDITHFFKVTYLIPLIMSAAFSFIGPQSIEIKNCYSLPKSLFGDNLKRTTCLPAFYHKGKVFPDFEGIAICCKLIK